MLKLTGRRVSVENHTKQPFNTMAAMKSSARDIPKPSGRDNLIAVAAKSVPTARAHPLPTPPNSISPSLPPHGLKPYGTRSTTAQTALEHVDSDLDLQDSPHGSGQDTFPELDHDIGSPGFETTGIITPTLLAKHHLPEILLNHGPLAIRHIMGYLTTSVPGFSGIPPAKARRVVVAALEGRGNGGEGGGLKGNVKFEKVGWGRWNARSKGHLNKIQHSPPPSVPSSYSVGMPIANPSGLSFDRTRLKAPESSWAGDSATFSNEDEMDIMSFVNEADKMSLDGSCSSSEAPPEDEPMGDEAEDMTDDEDWAAVGAAALRAASYSASGPGPNFLTSRYLAKSVPLRPSTHTHPLHDFDLSAFGMTSDFQEREAIEALLQLGSV